MGNVSCRDATYFPPLGKESRKAMAVFPLQVEVLSRGAKEIGTWISSDQFLAQNIERVFIILSAATAKQNPAFGAGFCFW